MALPDGLAFGDEVVCPADGNDQELCLVCWFAPEGTGWQESGGSVRGPWSKSSTLASLREDCIVVLLQAPTRMTAAGNLHLKYRNLRAIPVGDVQIRWLYQTDATAATSTLRHPGPAL